MPVTKTIETIKDDGVEKIVKTTEVGDGYTGVSPSEHSRKGCFGCPLPQKVVTTDFYVNDQLKIRFIDTDYGNTFIHYGEYEQWNRTSPLKKDNSHETSYDLPDRISELNYLNSTSSFV